MWSETLNEIANSSRYSAMVFAFVLFFFSKSNVLSNRILALLILFTSNFFQISWADFNPSGDLVYFILPLRPSVLIGILVFLYVKSLTIRRGNPNYNFWIPFLWIPLELMAFLYSKNVFIKTLSEDQFRDIVLKDDFLTAYMKSGFSIHLVAFQLIGVYYVFKAYKLQLTYVKQLKNSVSNYEHVDLRWLKQFTIAVLVITFSYFLAKFQIILSHKYWLFDIYRIFIQAFVYWAGIRSIKLSEIPEIDAKEIKEVIPDQQVKTILDQLNTSMQSEYLYTNTDLKLNDLANKLGIEARLISYTIKTGADTNFYDYVNRFRIDHFKKALRVPENQKKRIEDIAFKSGFNSRSTYNHLFKKETGIPPKEYRKKYPS